MSPATPGSSARSGWQSGMQSPHRTRDDLKKTLELLEWAADHALPSGILAEQIHPFTHEPLSVSPLTWSHAAYVSAVLTYLQNNVRVANIPKLE